MADYIYDSIRLFYEERGSRDGDITIGFLNGVMASTNSWDMITPVFEALGCRLILHDFMGQLKSEKPDRTYSFDEHCRQAKALYESLGVKELHLVGTSYGGEVAMRFAMLYPDMVRSISIIDSASELTPVMEGFLNGWKVLCSGGDGENFFHGMVPSIYGNAFIAKNKDMLATRAAAIKDNPNGYLEGQKHLYDTFLEDLYMTDRLQEIRCPALILCGQEDILKPPACAQILADGIPNSEYVLLPGCGHVSIFEKAGELSSAISGFIIKNSLFR